MFANVGHLIGYSNATAYDANAGYALRFDYNNGVYPNDGNWGRSEGLSIRCMEDCKYIR